MSLEEPNTLSSPLKKRIDFEELIISLFTEIKGRERL